MEYLNLINQQSTEIINIYDTIGEIIDNTENEMHNQSIVNNKIVEHTNENVKAINKRLNQMDLDILDNDKLQSKKREELSETLDKIIKENNQKNGLYKTDLTKRLSKIKRETDEDIKKANGDLGLIKVEMSKNNRNKDLEMQLRESRENLDKLSTEFLSYKKEMEIIVVSLRKECRITRNMMNKKTGITVKQ